MNDSTGPKRDRPETETSSAKRQQGQPFVAGPTFASAYHLAGDPHSTRYQYGRYANPSWDALETELGKLEGGEVRVFPSGAAAITATLMALCEPGDVVVLPSDAYFGTRKFASDYLEKWGLNLRLLATLEMSEADYTGVRLVFIESPSNPGLEVCDIAAVARKAHQAAATVVVDNTTASPLGQQPLALGADVSVSSDSKIINGHSDVIFGHIASADEQIIEKITAWRTITGSIAGPMETWLVQRGLATLDVRLDRHNANTMRVAQFLAELPAVESVRYPGLSGDPAHPVAAKQMTSFGNIVSFQLASEAAAEAFLAAGGIYQATSFGGLHTMAERRARWQGDEVPANAIRLSVGCEPIEQLLNQLAHNLSVSAQHG